MKYFITLFLLMVTLSGCAKNSENPKFIAQEFWSSVHEGKMDSAKQLVSWDTAGYLKYIQPSNFALKRVDFPESDKESTQDGENSTNVSIITELVIAREGSSADIKIPTRTVLKFSEGVWRVDLEKTLVEVINRSVNKVGEQFNIILKQGVDELNQALSGSINDISKSLEEGVKGFTGILQESLKEVESSLRKAREDLNHEKATKKSQ